MDMLGLNDLHIAHLPSKQRGIDAKMDPEYVLSREPDLIFVNVGTCYWDGLCSFETAGGWKWGDKHLLELLKERTDYALVRSAPTTICVFKRKETEK